MSEGRFAKYEELQNVLADLSCDNVTTVVDYIDRYLAESDVSAFATAVFGVIPARVLAYPLYADTLTRVKALSTGKKRTEFIERVHDALMEPNSQEFCYFSTFLVESKFFTAGELCDLVINVMTGVDRFECIQVIQLLYCVARIGAVLSAEEPEKLAQIIAVFRRRADAIKSGTAGDYNANLYLDLLDSLSDLEKSNWIVEDDYSCNRILGCLVRDDAARLRQLVDGGVDPNMTLDPSLLVSSSTLSFSPPLVCAAAFYGAVECVKALRACGVDFEAMDDEERTIAQFAAASGNVVLLEYLKGLGVSFTCSVSYAVEFWRNECFTWLHENVYPKMAGIEPEGVSTALHAAARVNNIHAIRVLASAGVDVLAQDEVFFLFIMLSFTFLLDSTSYRSRASFTRSTAVVVGHAW